jgi:hypothetical protein
VRHQDITGMSQHFNGIQLWRLDASGKVTNTYA